MTLYNFEERTNLWISHKHNYYYYYHFVVVVVAASSSELNSKVSCTAIRQVLHHGNVCDLAGPSKYKHAEQEMYTDVPYHLTPLHAINMMPIHGNVICD